MHRRGQPPPVVGGVVDAVEPGLPGVDLEPFLRAGRHRQLRLPPVQHRIRRRAPGGHPHRHLPEGAAAVPRLRNGAAVFREAVIEEPLLRQRQVHLPGGAFRRHLQNRIAHLLNPRVHNLHHRAARLFLQGRPEVFAPGVGVLVVGKVAVQPLPESFGAEELLQHPQHRGALAVADGVEELAHFGGVLHFLLDGVGVGQPVQAEGAAGVHIHELRPHFPLREQPVHRLGAHPRGKALVQPQVIPPLHRHQVAEPHMRHFVGHHFGHPLPGAGRRVGRVHQQRRFAVSHRPPVLHGAGRKVGNGEMVQLGQRVGDAEVIVEIAQQLDRSVQRETGLAFLARRGPYPHQRAVGGLRLHRRQVAHHKGQQIGGHYRRGGETHCFSPRTGAGFLHRRGVGNRLILRVEFQRNLEYGFGRRLVPAGKGAAGVGGLELRGRQITGFAGRRLVFRAVETEQLVVQLAGKGQRQLRRAGGQFQGKGQRHRFGLGVQGDAAVSDGFAADAQAGRGHFQLRRVHRDGAGRFGQFHFDDGVAAESERLQVGAQRQAVMAGPHPGGQDDGIGSGHRQFLTNQGQPGHRLRQTRQQAQNQRIGSPDAPQRPAA